MGGKSYGTAFRYNAIDTYPYNPRYNASTPSANAAASALDAGDVTDALYTGLASPLQPSLAAFSPPGYTNHAETGSDCPNGTKR